MNTNPEPRATDLDVRADYVDVTLSTVTAAIPMDTVRRIAQEAVKDAGHSLKGEQCLWTGDGRGGLVVRVPVHSVKVGDKVRYHGSLEAEHGYYTVAAIAENGRLHLIGGDGLCADGQRLSFVGPHNVTVLSCDRHGGTWGDDETCERCTHEDGTARPQADKGPLGLGATHDDE